jgi:hypothetical protein
VFLTLQDNPERDGAISVNSLADIVKFPVDTAVRVGSPRSNAVLEEAVVAVPFKLVEDKRKFIQFPTGGSTFNLETSTTYQALSASMDKYVFPPRFDFTRFEDIAPIMMYVFEFSAKLTQKDIADIWQNLPPDIGENFDTQHAVVEERELIDAILPGGEESGVQWMVFKVKKRAKKDFEVYRRSLLTDNVSAMAPSLAGKIPESYNWPYDYFSLVELAKIDEAVHYVSTDLKKLAPLTEQEALEVETITNPSTAGASDAPLPDLSGDGPPPTPPGLPGQSGDVEDQSQGDRLMRAKVLQLGQGAPPPIVIRKRVTTMELASPEPATNPLSRRRGTYSESND